MITLTEKEASDITTLLWETRNSPRTVAEIAQVALNLQNRLQQAKAQQDCQKKGKAPFRKVVQ